MKKILVVALVVAVSLIGANSAMAIIAGSKHDLSSSSTNTSIKASGTSVSACQFCHTPHLGTNPVVVGAPLWNRTISSGFFAGDGTSTYTVYGASAAGSDGNTLSQIGAVKAPGTNSKTCLSCHDGTLALSTILVGDNSTITGWTGNDVAANMTGNMLTGGSAALGTDLRQEHPIGIVYSPVLATSAGLEPTADLNNKVNGIWKLYNGGVNVGSVECGSCHDPHGNDRVAGGNNAPFLKGSKATICTDCHSLK